MRHTVDNTVVISAHTGAQPVGNPPEGIIWAVFLPSSRVDSSLTPYTVVLSSESKPGVDWDLNVHQTTGRTTVQRRS